MLRGVCGGLLRRGVLGAQALFGGARSMADHAIDLPEGAEYCSTCVIPTDVRTRPHPPHPPPPFPPPPLRAAYPVPLASPRCSPPRPSQSWAGWGKRRGLTGRARCSGQKCPWWAAGSTTTTPPCSPSGSQRGRASTSRCARASSSGGRTPAGRWPCARTPPPRPTRCWGPSISWSRSTSRAP